MFSDAAWLVIAVDVFRLLPSADTNAARSSGSFFKFDQPFMGAVVVFGEVYRSGRIVGNHGVCFSAANAIALSLLSTITSSPKALI